MTTTTTAIANHLNIAESIISEVQEWANVLWVRFVGRRARFVSKKIVETKKMNIPAPVQANYSTEWKDGKTLLDSTVVVSQHQSKKTFAAGFSTGSRIEWIGSFETLQQAWPAALAGRQNYLAEQSAAATRRDAGFAATAGMMQTSTGEWITADEWDQAEGQ